MPVFWRPKPGFNSYYYLYWSSLQQAQGHLKNPGSHYGQKDRRWENQRPLQEEVREEFAADLPFYRERILKTPPQVKWTKNSSFEPSVCFNNLHASHHHQKLVLRATLFREPYGLKWLFTGSHVKFFSRLPWCIRLWAKSQNLGKLCEMSSEKTWQMVMDTQKLSRTLARLSSRGWYDWKKATWSWKHLTAPLPLLSRWCSVWQRNEVNESEICRCMSCPGSLWANSTSERRF